MLEDGAAASAVDDARLAARSAPNDPAAQERYGLAAERARLYPEALAALDRAVSIGGPVRSRLMEQGRIALENGDVPAAMRAFNRVLEHDPHDVDALSNFGVAEDLQHRHNEAQAHYREALRIAPRDWAVRSNLALSQIMMSRSDDAAETLSAAANDRSAPRRARHDLALALVASGKRTAAIKVLKQDMPADEASTLADEFASFARWLASPQGSRPALR